MPLSTRARHQIQILYSSRQTQNRRAGRESIAGSEYESLRKLEENMYPLSNQEALNTEINPEIDSRKKSTQELLRQTNTKQVTARYKGRREILILAEYLCTALGWRWRQCGQASIPRLPRCKVVGRHRTPPNNMAADPRHLALRLHKQLPQNFSLLHRLPLQPQLLPPLRRVLHLLQRSSSDCARRNETVASSRVSPPPKTGGTRRGPGAAT